MICERSSPSAQVDARAAALSKASSSVMAPLRVATTRAQSSGKASSGNCATSPTSEVRTPRSAARTRPALASASLRSVALASARVPEATSSAPPTAVPRTPPTTAQGTAAMAATTTPVTPPPINPPARMLSAFRVPAPIMAPGKKPAAPPTVKPAHAPALPPSLAPAAARELIFWPMVTSSWLTQTRAAHEPRGNGWSLGVACTWAR
mmetsp:Transcript_13210/g.42210  ORF Transcript_13210/g.42210 Transcript_13210/m.42210 type:complete len:207 (+) Transcript_13210:506-1126(+)